MDIEQLKKEIRFRTARSGGSGGQHVNKVETKAEVILDIINSEAFTEVEKTMILEKLASKITNEGFLQIYNQESRSQLTNKENAEKKLIELLKEAIFIPKERKPARIPRAIKEARLKSKSIRSEVKAGRKNISLNQDTD